MRPESMVYLNSYGSVVINSYLWSNADEAWVIPFRVVPSSSVESASSASLLRLRGGGASMSFTLSKSYQLAMVINMTDCMRADH